MGIQEMWGKLLNILGRGEGNGGLGLLGRPADIGGRAVIGWLTEWRKCRLINPAASGIIYQITCSFCTRKVGWHMSG